MFAVLASVLIVMARGCQHHAHGHGHARTHVRVCELEPSLIRLCILNVGTGRWPLAEVLMPVRIHHCKRSYALGPDSGRLGVRSSWDN